MTNPSPRPALRKAEDATVHPAAPRPARPPRAPRPAAAADTEAGPRTIADTNREANAAAAARAKKPKGASAAPASAAAAPKAARKKHKFSGSTSDHMRVPDTEFTEHPAPTRKRRAASTAPASAITAPVEAVVEASPDLMTGKIVDLGARVPKKLRTAAKHEAKRRGLDLDAVTTELLHTWLSAPR